MRASERRTAQLGDLVVAAFDGAARFSADPLEVSRLAMLVVNRVLDRGRPTGPVPVDRPDGPA